METLFSLELLILGYLLKLILIPLFLVGNHLLTIHQKKHQKEYRKVFDVEGSEINSDPQSSLTKAKYFDVRRLISIIIITGFYFCLFVAAVIFRNDAYIPVLVDIGYGLTLGGSIYGFSMFVVRLLNMRYLKKHPDAISGKITITQRYGIATSYSMLIGSFLPLLVILLVTFNPIVLGMLLGNVLLLLIPLSVENKLRKREAEAK